MRNPRIVVVDNGASTIKLGVVAGKSKVVPRTITNAVVRSKGDKTTYVGQEIEKCHDFSSLHYRLPFERGYIVDWDAQKAVWDGLFTTDALAIAPTEASLLMTEPYFNLPNLQEVYDQFIFEEYEFQSYYRCTSASMIPHSTLFGSEDLQTPECIVIVDSGFSFTHVVPILNGNIVWHAVKRVDVGGKLLTNQLKELASFRQWNMMDETYIMNDVKESCCYVSADFKKDLELCRQHPNNSPILQEYILPDFSTNRHGRIRKADEIFEDSHQVLYMNNERFAVPEILFRPDDIGLEQCGVAAAISHSIALLPEDLQGMFWANIGLVGGTSKLPGFRNRVELELRSLAPVDCEVVIYQSSEPILDAFRGAVAFASQPDFDAHVVTRAEYLEIGSNACRRKFRDWKAPEKEAKGREASSGKGKGKSKDEDDDEDEVSTAKRGGRGRGRALAGQVSRRRG